MTKRKIFVLGLTHTGKNSLDAALRVLGYSCKHYPHPEHVLEEAEKYDVLSDTPVIPYMEKLDAAYPDARFILTVREIESWLISCKEHWRVREEFERAGQANRKRIYGSMDFNRKSFRAVYEKHEARVRKHFGSRPEKLLILDVCGGEGYEKLCRFLGLDVINKPFPHRNRSI